jgi:hypothetical protein
MKIGTWATRKRAVRESSNGVRNGEAAKIPGLVRAAILLSLVVRIGAADAQGAGHRHR